MKRKLNPADHLAAAATIPLSQPDAASTIRLKDALALLDGLAPVAVQWVKFDQRRQTGGDFGRLPAARLAGGKPAAELRRPTETEETAADRADVAADGHVLVPGTGKNPAHWVNATRNLVDTRTGNLVKIHIYLLTHVAGRKVYI